MFHVLHVASQNEQYPCFPCHPPLTSSTTKLWVTLATNTAFSSACSLQVVLIRSKASDRSTFPDAWCFMSWSNVEVLLLPLPSAKPTTLSLHRLGSNRAPSDHCWNDFKPPSTEDFSRNNLEGEDMLRANNRAQRQVPTAEMVSIPT